MADHASPSAAWFPDPEHEDARRWWDGQQWTQQTQDADTDSSTGDAADGTGEPGEPTSVTDGRGWWQRKRMLLPVVGIAGIMLGAVIAGADTDELAAAEAERDEAQAQLDAVESELAAERQRVEDDEALADAREELADLEQQIAELEEERDNAVVAAREEIEEERDEMIAAAEAEAEEIVAQAEGRVAALDEREAALDEREADLTQAEEREAMSTFSGGVHVVGEDIVPGVYRTEGGGNCYWARLSGLGGGLDDIIANGLPDGPATVEIQSSDAGFETSGCGQWTLVD